MSNTLRTGSLAKPDLQRASSKGLEIVTVLLRAGAATSPTAKINSPPRLTPELSWNG
ncbi:MAG TPA: hypothetical protein VND96_17570 [Candidatus Micrarchaeaceae archaeon]|nr:hypothetical protein [Candidatus Micrarchaeaceae archaeon]